MMSLRFVSILIFITTVSCKRNQYTEVACENYNLRLECPDNTVIKITESTYGRSNYHTCPHHSIRTNECAAVTSMSKVQSTCEGQRTCAIRASNSIFGNPCVYTYKYLNVTYSCEKAPKLGQLIVCEGRSKTLQCPKNKYIKINGATYGRTDRVTCPDPRIKTIECSTNTPVPIIKGQCQGRQSCGVASTNSLYGDPCRGTYKYLTVDFQCTGKGNAGVNKPN